MKKRNALSSMTSAQKILSGHRVSIPDSILEKWNLNTGDFVIVKQEGKRMYITPAKIIEA